MVCCRSDKTIPLKYKQIEKLITRIVKQYAISSVLKKIKKVLIRKSKIFDRLSKTPSNGGNGGHVIYSFLNFLNILSEFQFVLSKNFLLYLTIKYGNLITKQT